MSIVTDALESSVSKSTRYFDPLQSKFFARFNTPTGPVNIYPSSLLTDDNIQRLRKCILHLATMDFSVFTLQNTVYEIHKILGEDLLRELKLGLTLPLYRISERVYTSMVSVAGNPFINLVVPPRIRHGYYSTDIHPLYRATENDPALSMAFTSSLYNLAYLNQSISLIEYSWLFAQLLARVPEQDVDLGGASLCLVPDLYKRCANYQPETSLFRKISYLERPRDPALLETYNQISYQMDTTCTTYNGETTVNKLMLLVFILAAPSTVPYDDCPEPGTTMPVQYLTDYGTAYTQSVTKLLPGSCFALRLGTTGFGIPALSAVSQYGTHVLLFPATRECYAFLCKLYGIKPCDGITPLTGSYDMLWGSLFSPHTFIQVLRQEGITNFDSTRCAQYIFNDTHSLTEYIPGMEYSDAPQYRVNEFEVPK